MPATEEVSVTDVSPELLAAWMNEGGTTVVDVREDFEYSEERIEGAVLAPLSAFDPDEVRGAQGGVRVVFQCRSGRRSHEAAARFARGGDAVFHLAGGIEAWKQAGHPVTRSTSTKTLPVMRQVQIAAGSLVVLGIALGVGVSPWCFGIAGFVGCRLVFAGVSGWCGMAKLLALMPWNASLRASG